MDVWRYEQVGLGLERGDHQDEAEYESDVGIRETEAGLSVERVDDYLSQEVVALLCSTLKTSLLLY